MTMRAAAAVVIPDPSCAGRGEQAVAAAIAAAGQKLQLHSKRTGGRDDLTTAVCQKVWGGLCFGQEASAE